MKWIAYNGSLKIDNNIPMMKSTDTSSLNIQFDDGLDFLNFINSFIVPVAKKYGYDVTLKKDGEVVPAKIVPAKTS